MSILKVLERADAIELEILAGLEGGASSEQYDAWMAELRVLKLLAAAAFEGRETLGYVLN